MSTIVTLKRINGGKVLGANCLRHKIYIRYSCGGLEVINLDSDKDELCESCYNTTKTISGRCAKCKVRRG